MRQYNSKELVNFISKFIQTNKYNENKGLLPVSLEILGTPGLGKTSVVSQIGKLTSMPVVKFNAAQISDACDLVGNPVTEYEMCHIEHNDTRVDAILNQQFDGKCVWTTKEFVESQLALGFVPTGQIRTSYAPPAWIVGLDTTNGIIMLLDDLNRANADILQAVMELMLDYKYLSWSLPKGSTIIITNNPSESNVNGEFKSYNVAATDDAQKTRFLSVEMKFDKFEWAQWAERKHINTHAINFALFYPEIVEKITPRQFSQFAQMLSTVDIRDKSNVPYVMQLADSTRRDTLGAAFQVFLNKGLQDLVTPEEFMALEYKLAIEKLNKFIKDESGVKSQDREYIFIIRLSNYLNALTRQLNASECRKLVQILKDSIFEKDKMMNFIQDNNKIQLQLMTFDPEYLVAYAKEMTIK